jgi:hypothetical protein
LAIGLAVLNARAQGTSQPSLSESQLLNCERRLLELGYWVEAADGRFDDSTLVAIKAFRRLSGYRNPGPPNAADLRALEHARPLTRGTYGPPHFEVELSRQVIYFVDKGGKVSLILPVSTGSGKIFTEGGRTRRARTPKGSFTVYRKIFGWRESPMGKMYYPSYIVGGVAVHGSLHLADYPRTYGCIAVPMFAAERLSELMPIGTVVIIHA